MSLNLDNQSTNLKNIAWTTKQDIKLELLKNHESLSNGFVSISEDTRPQRDTPENNVSSLKMCNGISEEGNSITTTTSVSSLIYDSTSSSTEVKSSVLQTITKSEASETINSQITVPSAIDCKVEEQKELHSADPHLLPSLPISEQPDDPIEYVAYESELQMPQIMRLITKDLSEPYSIYTYRYFIHNWPKLCFLAMHRGECVGAIVCKLDFHKKNCKRGYIAMLAVDQGYRRKGIGSYLVIRAIRGMVSDNCDEVVLETEITNHAALHLYENLGFVRDKRLFRYYLNGVDALRLKLWLK